MATTKTVLKTYFEQGDIPTQGQYVELIDSQLNLGETGTQIVQGTISASAAIIEDMTFKKLYLPGLGIGSMKVGTTLRIGRTLEVSGSLNVEEGDIITNQNITASGNMEAVKYHSIGRNLLRYKSAWSASIIGMKDEDTLITGSTIQLGGKIVNGTSTTNDVNVTCSSDISASGLLTASAGYFRGRATIGGDLLQQGDTSFGNSLHHTHTFTGNITSSYNITALSASFTGGITASAESRFALGINIPQSTSTTIEWNNTQNTTFSLAKCFALTITNLPVIDYKLHFSPEYITITNTFVTTKSVIIINQAAINNIAGTDVQLLATNIINNRFTLKPYFSGGDTDGASSGGSATYNILII